MRLSRAPVGLSLAALAVPLAASAAPDCGWVEPPRTYPEGVTWACGATAWTDGDTLTAVCEGLAGAVLERRGVPQGVAAFERR